MSGSTEVGVERAEVERAAGRSRQGLDVVAADKRSGAPLRGLEPPIEFIRLLAGPARPGPARSVPEAVARGSRDRFPRLDFAARDAGAPASLHLTHHVDRPAIEGPAIMPFAGPPTALAHACYSGDRGIESGSGFAQERAAAPQRPPAQAPDRLMAAWPDATLLFHRLAALEAAKRRPDRPHRAVRPVHPRHAQLTPGPHTRTPRQTCPSYRPVHHAISR